jgi:hypothetical protein
MASATYGISHLPFSSLRSREPAMAPLHARIGAIGAGKIDLPQSFQAGVNF